jgi:hypothetical protein
MPWARLLTRPAPAWCRVSFTCSHSVRGILINRAEMVAKVNLLKKIYIPFLDGPPTKNRFSVRHENRVTREERG